MATEKLLARIANVKFGRLTKVTTFHKDTSISNMFKLILTSDSNDARMSDNYRQAMNKYQHQGWKLDFSRSSHAPYLEMSLNFPTKVKISKYCTSFSWNLPSIPRYISWHHWENLLTSNSGHSRASNFSTEFDQIWAKTSGVSRGLIFGPICECHTILESS